ncbi:MAG: dTDP-4-dehydrorhamnose reductase [Planctomycetota bacterium]|jgi:dTDP-4-dehydrorhamnose reductase
MRALIIGAAGQVGGALAEALDPGDTVGTWFEQEVPDSPRFELGVDDPAPLVGAARPDVVLIAAGMTHVDRCESEPDLAGRINRDGPAQVAAAARAAGARTVYYSTEYVFDGTAGPYTEEDAPNPLSVYGKSKLEGEGAVLDADPDALVLRTTVVYGPEAQGKNYVYRLVAALSEGREVPAPEDQISSPTYNRDLARATVALLNAEASGVFHVVGPELMSRVGFACAIANALGLDPALVKPVPTAALGQAAPRPLRAGLLDDKLCSVVPQEAWPRTLSESMQDWRARPGGKPLASWPP